jgi:lipopolysaccharide/colanic/teichoic acid biosynthesis glycosyltransferase
MASRFLDISISLVALIVLAPLLVLIGLLVRVSSPGPALHRATRVGLDGRLFQLCKFRSMYVGADRTGPGVTARDDRRVTPLGRWLRRYKLDELPQLMNVLAGEMSLVGPRPEDPRYVALYTEQQREILKVRPGITGAASLSYRREETLLGGADWERTYREVVMPDKIRIELEYLRHRGRLSDLRILARTLIAPFHHP